MTAKTKPLIGPETPLHRNPFMDINHVRVDFGAFRKDYFVVIFGPRAEASATRRRLTSSNLDLTCKRKSGAPDGGEMVSKAETMSLLA